MLHFWSPHAGGAHFLHADDLGETKDLSANHPEIVARIERIMREQHVPSKLFLFKAIDGK